jgi:hypothetical protein
MLTNWKTTSAGILAIIGALVGLVFAIINKNLTPDVIMACATGILGGIGLLFAKDSNVTGGNVSNGLKLPLKLILFVVILSGIGLATQAQGLTQKVCPKDFTVKAKIHDLRSLTLNQDSVLTSLNKWTLATGVNAMSLNLKTGVFGAINSGGLGIVRAWYKETSDKLTVYKTFSAGGMLLFGDTNGSSLVNLNTSKGTIDVGIMAVGGFGPLSLGPTYFVTSKTLLLNLQATFTF